MRGNFKKCHAKQRRRRDFLSSVLRLIALKMNINVFKQTAFLATMTKVTVSIKMEKPKMQNYKMIAKKNIF